MTGSDYFWLLKIQVVYLIWTDHLLKALTSGCVPYCTVNKNVSSFIDLYLFMIYLLLCVQDTMQ